DMVEEGVTWFAQVSPRQPRTLVLVVPPLAWLFAPLPLLVVLAASLGPSRLFGALADVPRSHATVAGRACSVTHQALLEPAPVADWINCSISILVPVLALAVLSRRARSFVLLGVGIFASLVLLADVVYYRFFGDVWSTPALLAARQTGHVWGSVGSLFTARLLPLGIA